MKIKFASSPINQKGAALIVSLIILVVMTLIGTAGMQVTTLEEKMAGNTKELNLAFQAAEASLRGGEKYLESIVALSAFSGANGLYGEDDNPDYSALSTWGNSSSVEYSTTIPQVGSQPRFYIKYVGDVVADDNAKINLGGYGENIAGGTASVFKVVVKGTSATDTARVYLQSNYGKRF